eukprot:Clim_evm96s147 gene=Clim_evmTU96s147
MPSSTKPLGDKDVWHGTLKINIIAARHLRNADALLPSKLGRMLSKVTRDLSDPYVTVRIGHNRLIKTKRHDNTLDPHFNEKYEIPIADIGDKLEISVKDDDAAGVDHLGFVWFDMKELATGEPKDGWFPLKKENGENEKGELHLEIEFVTVEKTKMTPEVPHVYYPIRTGCSVRLYHDARVNPEQAERLKQFPLNLDGNAVYDDRSCWDDMWDSIKEAKEFIYIAGWAVWADLIMNRDAEGKGETLGEVLKQRAEDGLRICILVWNDLSSNKGIISTGGVMGTHDEETFAYFKKTKVKMFHVERAGGESNSMLESKSVGGLFTHHQKLVVCDAPKSVEACNVRHIIAYCGGIDLTDGRYDDGSHPLWRTLTGVHKGDSANHCYELDPTVGPRQPWHDIHSRVEGQAARDIMINFEERWHKQVKLLHHRDLVHLTHVKNLIQPAKDIHHNQEEWAVQILRSIDGRSAQMGKHADEGLKEEYLNLKKGRHVDDSIHRAYVHQIRRAKKHIYIENQYFLGSCHAWDSHQDMEACQLVPLEISLKCCEKIRAGEDFCAYIVIPIYPEGDPESATIQEILHWQYNTIQFMYKMIHACLKEVGSDKKATDYLTFYCPVNRETEEGSQASGVAKKGMGQTLAKTRRFMIYVHSKLMIVDDEYVIIGSANINQRSMGANRDTEICMGGYQMHHHVKHGATPRGQVYGFRMALFNEHLNGLKEEYRDPAKPECVAAVREVCEENAKLFLQEKPVDMKGHLILYPYQPDDEGILKCLPGFETVPDCKASFFGSDAAALPNILTT